MFQDFYKYDKSVFLLRIKKHKKVLYSYEKWKKYENIIELSFCKSSAEFPLLIWSTQVKKKCEFVCNSYWVETKMSCWKCVAVETKRCPSDALQGMRLRETGRKTSEQRVFFFFVQLVSFTFYQFKSDCFFWSFMLERKSPRLFSIDFTREML